MQHKTRGTLLGVEKPPELNAQDNITKTTSVQSSKPIADSDMQALGKGFSMGLSGVGKKRMQKQLQVGSDDGGNSEGDNDEDDDDEDEDSDESEDDDEESDDDEDSESSGDGSEAPDVKKKPSASRRIRLEISDDEKESTPRKGTH